MLALLHRFAPRLRLLLLLALALGGFLFLFDLFVGLIATGPKDLLAQNSSVSPTTRIPSSAGLITTLASATFMALGAGALFLLWRQPDGGEGRRWVVALGALPAAALLCLGAYLALSGSLAPGLPVGEVPYSHHQVEVAGIRPLALALLAAFVLSVVFVGITKPRLLPVPLGLWLAAGLMFGLLGSTALYGLNLFGHPTTLQTSPAYASAVERYRQPEGEPAPAPVSVAETPPQSETVAAETLLRDLRLGDAWTKETAIKLLEESGAEVIRLETGGSLIRWGELRYWVPGVTTRRAARPDLEPVFRVSGAVDTAYLRTAVGDTYTDGGWTQLDPVVLPYGANTRVRPLVEQRISGPRDYTSPDPESALLAWDRTGRRASGERNHGVPPRRVWARTAGSIAHIAGPGRDSGRRRTQALQRHFHVRIRLGQLLLGQRHTRAFQGATGQSPGRHRPHLHPIARRPAGAGAGTGPGDYPGAPRPLPLNAGGVWSHLLSLRPRARGWDRARRQRIMVGATSRLFWGGSHQGLLVALLAQPTTVQRGGGGSRRLPAGEAVEILWETDSQCQLRPGESRQSYLAPGRLAQQPVLPGDYLAGEWEGITA